MFVCSAHKQDKLSRESGMEAFKGDERRCGFDEVDVVGGFQDGRLNARAVEANLLSSLAEQSLQTGAEV